jgi:hypothetical protein
MTDAALHMSALRPTPAIDLRHCLANIPPLCGQYGNRGALLAGADCAVSRRRQRGAATGLTR